MRYKLLNQDTDRTFAFVLEVDDHVLGKLTRFDKNRNLSDRHCTATRRLHRD